MGGMDVGEHTFELLKKLHAEFSDFRREQDSARMPLSSLEQHYATMSGDLAQIRVELDDIRRDVSLIKRRLDLVDA
jgi:predicted  nucleic acid-binding Zn-ribbon protein